jgi:hypothetical protein
MMKRLLAVVVALLLAGSCSAKDEIALPASAPSVADASNPATTDETPKRATQREGGNEISAPGVWNKVMRKAQEKAGAIKNVGKPRVVAKGAKPELVIGFDGSIMFDMKPLRLGDHIDKWRNIFPKDVVCTESKGGTFDATICDWDSLGISVMGSIDRPNIVSQIEIHLNFSALEPWVIPNKTDRKSRPEKTFGGYLEIDGYGIDSHTKFWELRAGADGRRNLRCGLTDCTHPHGGGTNHTISIRVDGKSEYDRLRTITVLGG